MAEPTSTTDSGTLPPGTRLNEFELEVVIGEGGFGIVYRARDTQLQRIVAIKEYMPTSLSARRGDGQVTLRSERHRETFMVGLRSFMNEARLLAAFDHPALVKVYRFWEANGTAYMVMPFLEGTTLKAHIARNGPPSEQWLMGLLTPLLDALELLHGHSCYHRDIAPDNIILLDASDAPRPVLLDFGAARKVIGDATQALTVILKPGYAPLEQYAEVGSMRQGPWTDVYALCATIYAVICGGGAPPPAVARVVTDELVPARQRAKGRYGDQLLSAVDAGLAVRPENRPNSISELRRLLNDAQDNLLQDFTEDPRPFGSRQASEPRESDVTVLAAPKRVPRPKAAADDDDQTRLQPSSAVQRAAKARGQATPIGGRPNKVVWIGASVLTAAVAFTVAYLWLVPSPPRISPATPQIVSPPVVPVVPALPETPPPIVPNRSFSVAQAFADVISAGDPVAKVQVTSSKPQLIIGKDKVAFDVTSDLTGHLYVFSADPDRRDVHMLFPNRLDGANRIGKGQTIRLPRQQWELVAAGPPGALVIFALVSASPLAFQASGLLTGQGAIQVLNLPAVQSRFAHPSYARDQRAWLPEPTCQGQAGCDSRFAAALMELEEVSR